MRLHRMARSARASTVAARRGSVTVTVRTAPAKRKSGTTHRNKATTKKAPAKKTGVGKKYCSTQGKKVQKGGKNGARPLSGIRCAYTVSVSILYYITPCPSDGDASVRLYIRYIRSDESCSPSCNQNHGSCRSRSSMRVIPQCGLSVDLDGGALHLQAPPSTPAAPRANRMPDGEMLRVSMRMRAVCVCVHL